MSSPHEEDTDLQTLLTMSKDKPEDSLVTVPIEGTVVRNMLHHYSAIAADEAVMRSYGIHADRDKHIVTVAKMFEVQPNGTVRYVEVTRAVLERLHLLVKAAP